jgi:hypothetical protein
LEDKRNKSGCDMKKSALLQSGLRHDSGRNGGMIREDLGTR